MHDDTWMITLDDYLDDDDDAYHCAFDVAYDTTCEYSNDFAFHACDEKMKRASDDRTQHTKMSKRYFPTA